MNKPLKLLLVVAVLAFAAAGLYYAMQAPARTGKVATNPPRQNQSRGVVFDEGSPRPPSENPSAPPAVTPTAPSSDRAMDKPAAASSTSAVVTSTSAPTGFTNLNEPMKALPNTLPGFEPVRADGAPVKAAPADATTPGSPAPNAMPASPLAPATPVGTTSGATSTTSAPAPSTGASARPATPPAPAALPALPAPAKPAPAPASVTPAATTTLAAKTAGADTYTVKEGDSIASIWRSISGSERGWEKLLAANPGVDPSRLKIGQVLKVPDHKAAAASEAREAASTTTKPSAAGTYTVQSGDTLSRIAAKTLGDSKRWKEIYDANRDTLGNDPGTLEVGQTLKIPGKGAAAKPAASKPADKPAEPKPASIPAPAAPPSGVIGGSGAPAPSAAPTTSPTPAPR